MLKQIDRLFERPQLLRWSTSIFAIRERDSLLLIQPADSNAEPENPEGGDQGVVRWSGGKMAFTKVELAKDRSAWYACSPPIHAPQVGDEVEITIDSKRRLHHAANHTFSHLLTAIARKRWRNELLATSRVFSAHGELRISGEGCRLEDAQEIWSDAMGYIAVDDATEQKVLPRAEALALAGQHFEAVLPKSVKELRVVHVGKDLPWIPCRGVHLANLSQIRRAERLSPERVQGNDLVFSYILQYGQLGTNHE